eukprot:12196148-Karenia_brevis.AAC.1
MFVGTSGWLLRQFCVRSHAQCDPLKLHRQRISDHCPVISSIAAKMPCAGAQPIPDWVCNSVEFKKQVRKVLAQLPLDSLAVNDRLERVKLVMREVGTQVRNRLSHD